MLKQGVGNIIKRVYETIPSLLYFTREFFVKGKQSDHLMLQFTFRARQMSNYRIDSITNST